jgi:hypothetical protein
MSVQDENVLLDYLYDGAENNNVAPLKIQGALALAMGSPYFQLS